MNRRGFFALLAAAIAPRASRTPSNRWGGIQAFWIDESEQAKFIVPNVRLLDLRLKKLQALVYITDELPMDSRYWRLKFAGTNLSRIHLGKWSVST